MHVGVGDAYTGVQSVCADCDTRGKRMHITVCARYLGLCKRVRFLRGLRIWVGHELIVYNEPPARIDRFAHTGTASFKHFARRQIRRILRARRTVRRVQGNWSKLLQITLGGIKHTPLSLIIPSEFVGVFGRMIKCVRRDAFVPAWANCRSREPKPAKHHVVRGSAGLKPCCHVTFC